MVASTPVNVDAIILDERGERRLSRIGQRWDRIIRSGHCSPKVDIRYALLCMMVRAKHGPMPEEQPRPFPRAAARHSVKVTETELIYQLQLRAGAFPVTIEARTIPAMAKTDNPYAGNCVKLSRVNGMLNWQYERAVNRQRGRKGDAGDFEAMPRKWGRRVDGTPFVQHNGKVYLELKVQRSLGYEYRTLDGVAIDPAELTPFLRSAGETRQGVEREVILRDYALASIDAITFDGQRYEIDRSETLALVKAA
jgi:hypothetical protein